jgi:hypothetical protein
LERRGATRISSFDFIIEVFITLLQYLDKGFMFKHLWVMALTPAKALSREPTSIIMAQAFLTAHHLGK